jgi:CheY-like chemotaxis protein
MMTVNQSNQAKSRTCAAPNRSEMPVIMVVEDNVATRGAARGLFESLGCEVIEAVSGEVALGLIEMGRIPHAIILDFQLSGISGPQFYRLLRECPVCSQVAVVPFTSHWNHPLGDGRLVGSWMAARTLEYRKSGVTNNSSPVIEKRPGTGADGWDDLVLMVGHLLAEKNVPLPHYFKEHMSRIEHLFHAAR